MRQDRLGTFEGKQSSNGGAKTITAKTGVASTDVIDFTSDRDIGVGEPLVVVVVTSTLEDGDGDETYSVDVETASAENFGTGKRTVATIGLVRGAPGIATAYLPKDGTVDRYLRLNFKNGGTSPSITVEDAYLVPEQFVPHDRQYPKAYSFS